MANTALVASINEDGYKGSNSFAKQQDNNLSTNATRPCTSTLPEVDSSNVQEMPYLLHTFSSGQLLGSHPLVVRFMKGVYEQRPSLPRYKNI